MTNRDELVADVLSTPAAGDPAPEELVAYARQASALAPGVRARVEQWLAASPAHRDRFRAIAPADWTIAGSCLCGGVRYEQRGPLSAIGHCHCRICRKAHGAAFGTFAIALAGAFRFTAGEELLKNFEPVKGRSRAFCGRCGSTLTGAAPPGYVAIAVATLDVDPVSRPSLHSHFDERVPWLQVFDDLGHLEGSWE